MRIQYKLFASLLLSSVLLVTTMFLLMQWSIGRGMLDYVNTREAKMLQPLISELSDIYNKDSSWQTLADNPILWRQLQANNHPMRSMPPRPRPQHQSGNSTPPHDAGPGPRRGPGARGKSKPIGLLLLDSQKMYVAGPPMVIRGEPSPEHFNQIAIEYQNQTIGWLVLPRRHKIIDGFELKFLQQLRESFLIISLVVIVLAALIAFPLARSLVRPIKQLADNARQLNRGRYPSALSGQRRDELGQLARDFNQLANTLQRNEASRKRWLADISHELRTPLAILRGEIDAIADGLRVASSENIASLQQEVLHLSKLVDDLYQLSNTDIGGLRYQHSSLDLSALLSREVAHNQQKMLDKNLQLSLSSPPKPITLWADETRLHQLLSNLLANSQKYTDEGGQVQLSVSRQGEQISICLEDSSPAVPDDALAHLFDHLYRVDSSRNRNTGGSGLGLAICRGIVEAHGGQISATHSALGGLAIHITLPINHRSH